MNIGANVHVKCWWNWSLLSSFVLCQGQFVSRGLILKTQRERDPRNWIREEDCKYLFLIEIFLGEKLLLSTLVFFFIRRERFRDLDKLSLVKLFTVFFLFLLVWKNDAHFNWYTQGSSYNRLVIPNYSSLKYSKIRVFFIKYSRVPGYSNWKKQLDLSCVTRL